MLLPRLSDEERHKLQALKAVVKAALSHIPGLGEGIKSYEAYQRSKCDLYVRNWLIALEDRIDDIKVLFSDEWLRTDEGQQYVRKLFACVADAELEDKHQLFANAFISGIRDKQLPYPQKLKFVDMLRQLSYDALLVLDEMHQLYAKDAYVPGKPDPGIPPSPITTDRVIEQLKGQFNPYRIESALCEMAAYGLFSRWDSWRDYGDGTLRSMHSISSKGEAGYYTEFTVRFVEFIQGKKTVKSQNPGTRDVIQK